MSSQRKLDLSRQSSTEMDESLEQLQSKKIKLEEQRMQSLDCSSVSGSNYPNQPLNLSARLETSNTANQASHRQRNNAELARLTMELGLNIPELLPTSSNVSAHQTNLNAGVVAQRGSITIQPQQLSVQTINSSAPGASSNTACSSGRQLAVADQENATYSPSELQSALDFVWNRLGTKELNRPQAQLATHMTGGGSCTWKWLEPRTQQLQQISAQDALTAFCHQMTEEALQNVSPPPQPPAADHNAENVFERRKRFDALRSKNAKMVLDNLLLASKSVGQEPSDNGTTKKEAMKSGFRFLHYLETHNTPGINDMRILEFRKFLNKLKDAVDTQNERK